jgi:hypothetical protein
MAEGREAILDVQILPAASCSREMIRANPDNELPGWNRCAETSQLRPGSAALT